MEEFNGNPKPITVNNSPHTNIVFEENKCLQNSYKMAKSINCMIVEGVLLTVENGMVKSVNRHCWNKTDNGYFDVTKDYVWKSDNFKHKMIANNINPDNATYLYLKCMEYNLNMINKKNNVITFRYNYDRLINTIWKRIESNTKGSPFDL